MKSIKTRNPVKFKTGSRFRPTSSNFSGESVFWGNEANDPVDEDVSELTWDQLDIFWENASFTWD